MSSVKKRLYSLHAKTEQGIPTLSTVCTGIPTDKESM